MDKRHGEDALARLSGIAVLREHTFTSNVSLIGGLIAAFRRGWNNVSTRWYVAPAMAQQSEFNQLVVKCLAEMMDRLNGQAEGLTALRRETSEQMAVLRDATAADATETARLEEWLIQQDREQTELRHDLGELELVLRRLLRLGEREDFPREESRPSQETDRPA